MTNAIALRMEPELIKKIDMLGRDEFLDRSTVIRKLVRIGYKELQKENAARLYKEGKITFSEAAHRADLTLVDMQHYLVDKGITSNYSIEDFEREMRLLEQNY